MKKSTLLFLAVLFSSIGLKAQYDAMFTQYMFNEMYINPAYAGSKEAMAININHRQQWVSFPGRPVTSSFTLHGPLKNNKMGLGVSFLNEQIGKLSRNLLYVNYAYRIKTGDKGHLAFGLMGGIHTQTNKLAELKSNDAGDIQIAQNTLTIKSPNFGAGIYYSTKTFYAGFSIPRMVDDSYRFQSLGQIETSTKINVNRFHYYLTVGNIFELGENVKVKPQAMIKMVQNAPVQYDLNVNFLLKNKFWLGASYRSSNDVSAILGYQVNNQLLVSYSYDYSFSKIQKYSQGSHEITLSYLFSYKKRNVATPRYF